VCSVAETNVAEKALVAKEVSLGRTNGDIKKFRVGMARLRSIEIELMLTIVSNAVLGMVQDFERPNEVHGIHTSVHCE